MQREHWSCMEAGKYFGVANAQMLAQLREMEAKYEAAVTRLESEQQELIREYLTQCEAMSWRLLEFACAEFSNDNEKS